MSKRFRIAKRISMEDIDHFEDIEVDDDFVDKDMVQIIADNEYDPMYDDCESIAVALQLAGYGKIADLEAKLAESEETIKYLKGIKRYDIGEMLTENTKLKQQLANKDVDLSLARNEINTLKCNLKVAQEHDNIVCKQLFEKSKEINQDKISFCIEKLEKVKKFVIRQLFITTKDCSELDEAEAKGCNELREETIKEIDNQIEQLKKEMK